MFLCSFKALNRGLYGNLAHDARLCLMWALMSCKDHSQGLYPTTQMVGQVPATSSTQGVALSIGVVIREPLDPILQDTNLSYVSSLEYIYISLCTWHNRISATSSLKMFRVCLFDG
jgi:hypothetical protein